MNNYINSVKYTKQLENGTFKRVTEDFLVQAYSFTDSEARIYDELGNLIKGEFEVEAIKKEAVLDFIEDDNSSLWWKVKASMVDGDVDKPKKVTHLYFVTGETVSEVNETFNAYVDTTMCDYTIESVVCYPKLQEIYKFESNETNS